MFAVPFTGPFQKTEGFCDPRAQEAQPPEFGQHAAWQTEKVGAEVDAKAIFRTQHLHDQHCEGLGGPPEAIDDEGDDVGWEQPGKGVGQV